MQRSVNKNITSVVVGIGSYNDIGIIRSCGEYGIKSIYINTAHFDLIPIWKSRYIQEFLYIDDNQKILDYIIYKATSNPEIIYSIFGASDAATLLFDKNFNKFPSNVIVQHAKGKLERLMDKDIMGKMATEAGLTVPKTWMVLLTEKFLPPLLPVILKPVESVNGDKADITICDTIEEYQRAVYKLKSKGYTKVLVQQYIHSNKSKEIGITGIAHTDGTVEFYGYIDKIRNRSNINNYGIYHPHKDLGISESLTTFIRSTNYVGIFDTDFILEGQVPYFIECNFRNGAYGYAVTHSGFNMPYCMIHDESLSNPEKLKDTCFME